MIMTYYFSTTVRGDFESVIEKVIQLLQKEGFGILTKIDIQQTLKKKLNVDFNKYKILGACNPSFAYKALQAENKIGTMLPCNIIVQELDRDHIEVAAVNPLLSMQAVNNEKLDGIAQEVRNKLENVINSIKSEE